MGKKNKHGLVQEDMPQASQSGKGCLRGCLWSLLIFILIIAALGGGSVYYVKKALEPVPSSSTPVQVEIAKGMGSRQIAALLEREGLIKNRLVFTYYLKYKHEGTHFQAGKYMMTPGISLDGIIQKLNSGDTIKQATIRFTIPEGFTVRQMAEKLSSEGLIDKHKFLQLANQPELFKNPLLADIPQDQSLKYKLEGYLFAETYEMKKGSDEKAIMATMLNELEHKLATLPAGWHDQLKRQGINFHQMLTIASLVEREAILAEERPVIAGVIYNRLHAKAPMNRLQIDAAIQYALGKQKEALSTDDIKVDSPYNTYTHEGLPPGPIASPSLSSIKAALYPESNKYLFYVAKNDGSRGHYFAKTYNEFLKDKNKSKQNAK